MFIDGCLWKETMDVSTINWRRDSCVCVKEHVPFSFSQPPIVWIVSGSPHPNWILASNTCQICHQGWDITKSVPEGCHGWMHKTKRPSNAGLSGTGETLGGWMWQFPWLHEHWCEIFHLMITYRDEDMWIQYHRIIADQVKLNKKKIHDHLEFLGTWPNYLNSALHRDAQ